MTSLTQFGTYGFLSTLLAAQTAMVHELETKKASIGTNRRVVAAKKPGQSQLVDTRKTRRSLAA